MQVTGTGIASGNVPHPCPAFPLAGDASPFIIFCIFCGTPIRYLSKLATALIGRADVSTR
jgi:hypothetical protein